MHKNPSARFSSGFAKGFTLVELLLAIAVLAILVSLSLSIINPERLRQKVRDTQRKKDLEIIALALEQYYADHNAYPSTDFAGLTTALSPAAPGTVYIKTVPNDSVTGRSYCYQADASTQNFVLCSALEADNVDGNSPDAYVDECTPTPDPISDPDVGRHCIANPL